MNRTENKFNIFIYICYAFLIPLVCVLSMEHILVCNSGFLNLLLFGIEAASPAIAAILTVLHRQGIAGVKRFLNQKYRESFSFKMCAIGFLIPALVLTFAKLATYVTPYHNQFITLPNPKKVIILLWALVAEELGWRGYLQYEIEKKCGSNLTPILVGLTWTVWHYHFFISGTMEVPIMIFTYGCVAESYGYYVITKQSKGNIVPASIWHFSGNLFFNLYLFNPNWNGGSTVPYVIASIFITIYIGLFCCYSRNKRL